LLFGGEHGRRCFYPLLSSERRGYSRYSVGAMENLAGTIPAALMRAERKPDVITFLKGTSLSSFDRRRLLHLWGYAVKVDLKREDYEAVTEA